MNADEEVKKLVALTLKSIKQHNSLLSKDTIKTDEQNSLDYSKISSSIITNKHEIAKSIIIKAQEQGITLEYSAQLETILATIELNHHIPFEAYMIVAEIIISLLKTPILE